MTFQEPDEKTIARMTVQSLEALIEALKTKRAEVIAPHDAQIKFYENLLEKKRHATTAG